jgi:hypothetical protein
MDQVRNLGSFPPSRQKDSIRSKSRGSPANIRPSYADATHVAVVDFEQEKRPFCYFQEYRKAWYLHFETLQEIAQEVLQARDEIVSTFLRVSVQPKTPEKDEM